MEKLVSVLGLTVFIGIAWLCSARRDRFPARTVLCGIGIQTLIALVTLRTEAGRAFFAAVGQAFQKLLGFAAEGCAMVFGSLADTSLLDEKLGPGNGFIFAITVTGTIVMVSALSSLLYHYGILQFVVRWVARAMQKVMGTSGSESLAAAANIFMGQTEAPLVIKPYLKTMTASELMALMVGGMATIAGGVLAAYVGIGINAGHLLTASVMSAPAALAMAKILQPETERSPTRGGANAKIERETANGLDAMCHGAADGVKLAINVMGMLIAFVAMVALANYLLSLGLRVFGVDQAKPMQVALGWLNAPVAWLIGVPWRDCFGVGAILGERVVLNEFIGYITLADAIKAGTLDPRSATLATYALCGFANFSSIAIQIGGIGALAPERRADLARLGLKAMLGGLLACYCTAAIASLMLD